MRVIVGISGASGSVYAQRLIAALLVLDVSVTLVFSRNGRLVWEHELGVDPKELNVTIHGGSDMTAPIASGSAQFDAMVVVPCSAGSVGRIAHGLSTNLIGRAADVMLKERRPLILVVRETPYSLPLIKNMVAVTEAGAVVLPASPSFYAMPLSIDNLVDTVVARILDQLGIDNSVSQRWGGMR